MSRKTTIPTRTGFGRTYWHLLAWIGWTCLVLGVSAMSLKDHDALRTLTTAHFSWPGDAVESEVTRCYEQIDTAPPMASTTGTTTASRGVAAPSQWGRGY